MTIEWGTKGKVSALVDGQFGSCGKGLIAAYLAEQIKEPLDVATCNAGAQAGHTTITREGKKFICFHTPTTGVMRGESLIYVNAGSIIDIESFAKEIGDIQINPKRIVVHPRAAVIGVVDRDAEREHGSATEKSASTQKGVGHALTRKIMRKAKLAGDMDWTGLGVYCEALDLNNLLSLGHSITMEVPQGFDLSLNHGLAYPYTTSRDCWVGSGLNDAGIHPSYLGPTCMVVRTFPIRVGAIFNELGEKLGDSGPFWPDSRELDWERDFPGIEPERTTVTKRVRRIATWSDAQYKRALTMNMPTIVALNFANYLKSHIELAELVQRMERVHIDLDWHPHLLFGFGPAIQDVTHSFREALKWYTNRSFG